MPPSHLYLSGPILIECHLLTRAERMHMRIETGGGIVVTRDYSSQHRYKIHAYIHANPAHACQPSQLVPQTLADLDKHEAKLRRRRHEQSHGIGVHDACIRFSFTSAILAPQPLSLDQAWRSSCSECPAWRNTLGFWWTRDITRWRR